MKVDDDLAGIIYAGDPLGLQKYRVKRRYFPFSGNTPDEIAGLLSSQFVLDEPKVLYSNFDLIFKELEAENPEFWTTTDIKKQADLVKKKVEEYMQRLKAQQPVITVDSFREDSAGAAGDGGDGNPADPGEPDPNKSGDNGNN